MSCKLTIWPGGKKAVLLDVRVNFIKPFIYQTVLLLTIISHKCKPWSHISMCTDTAGFNLELYTLMQTVKSTFFQSPNVRWIPWATGLIGKKPYNATYSLVWSWKAGSNYSGLVHLGWMVLTWRKMLDYKLVKWNWNIWAKSLIRLQHPFKANASGNKNVQ